jgi:hypothetical protein
VMTRAMPQFEFVVLAIQLPLLWSEG